MKKYARAIVFQNGSIGDFLMTVFLAEQLHVSGTVPKVHIIVPRNAAFFRGFIGSYPYIVIHEISSHAPLSLGLLLHFAFGRTLALVPPTPGTHPHSLLWAAWSITRWPGSRLIGFADAGTLAPKLYSVCLVYDTSIPFIDTMRSLITAAGAVPDDNPPHLQIIPDARALERYSLVDTRYVFFHPRGSADKRSFLAEDSIRLITALLNHDSKRAVVVSGSRADLAWVENMVEQLGSKDRVHIVCGAPVDALAALIENAELYIGVDTGITHLACFLGVHTLVVAHAGTVNWLSFYHPKARILYRFAEDTDAHEGQEYLEAHRQDRLKPFGTVPVEAVIKAAGEMLVSI
jgi:hypothetical protein